ncbi:MAG TPA: glycosyltransferase family 39 protein [Bryobacteraceae bacterium]|nr:glycosyltransferase family 39 protein [Bryobacteraceae bacterium]
MNLIKWFRNPWNLTLAALLIACIARLWLFPISQSFWVDEMVTAYVVHHGANDPSFVDAPQVPKSIYYPVARAADSIFGVSEAGYRVPSIVFAAIALLLIALLAARLIHPDAGWFAVFACLALKGFNTESADARPYALGFCVAAAAFVFLVRWLDSNRWTDALAFAIFAALVWRVHLIFWPLYLAFAVYALVRLLKQETEVGWLRALLVFGAVALALVPVLIGAVPIFRSGNAHVIVPMPSLRELADSLKWKLVLTCLGAAAIIARVLRRTPDPTALAWASISLIAGWWLIDPISLFAYSRLTGNSVFVNRYLSIALPGAALAATFAVALVLPRPNWKLSAAVLGLGVLITLGQWGRPVRANSDWRAAARKVSELTLDADTPVICPSPFVEAQPPVWRPDYPLPGFLYAHLPVYTFSGHAYLFPFKNSPEGELYATKLSQDLLPKSRRFILYGGDVNVHRWRDWFEKRPELEGWKETDLGPFGDVDVVMFDCAR